MCSIPSATKVLDLLSLACYKDDYTVFEKLADMGWPMRKDLILKDKALTIACKYGNLEVTKWLIKHGANIHTYVDRPIRIASENGHLEVVKYLFLHGSDLSTGNDTPICRASENGHLEVIKYLFSQGVDIQAWN